MAGSREEAKGTKGTMNRKTSLRKLFERKQRANEEKELNRKYT
jgi:hypothetical protein